VHVDVAINHKDDDAALLLLLLLFIDMLFYCELNHPPEHVYRKI